MGKNDGNIPGPAVTGEGKPTRELDADELREVGAEVEKGVLREEEPDPNQHGPAITAEAHGGSALAAWEDQYAMPPEEYLMRYGEGARGSDLAAAAITERE